MNKKILKVYRLLGLLGLNTIVGCQSIDNFQIQPTCEIRQICDDVLGSKDAMVDFPLNKEEEKKIQNAIDIMRACENKYGGVGISASQCFDIAKPIDLIIIGTNDPKIREGIEKRHPGEVVPYETIALNPSIVSYGKEMYFPSSGEGCLSVQGAIMGKVRRYKEVEIQYYDVKGNKVQKWVKDFEAHIFQHEIDHLQGIEFLNHIFKDCDNEQLQIISDMVNKKIVERGDGPDLTPKKNTSIGMIFDREGEKVTFQKNFLEQALSMTPTTTLKGITKVLDAEIQSR